MKKILHIIMLVTLTLTPVLAIIYFMFDGVLLWIIGGLALTLWAILVTFSEKVVLAFLGCREVIDRDYRSIFQCIKHEAYRRNVSAPKLYFHDSSQKKFLILQGYQSWTIVMDRELLFGLRENALKEFVAAVFDYRAMAGTKLNSQVMCLVACYGSIIHNFLRKVLFLKERGFLYKAFSSFALILLIPLALVLEKVSKSEIPLFKYPNLRELYFEKINAKNTKSYIDYFVEFLNNNVSLRYLLAAYLESYLEVREEV